MLGEITMVPDAVAPGASMAPQLVGDEGEHSVLDREESKAKRLGGLVLTRHLGESIMIGDEVEVHVVGIKSGTVRLKFVAPRTIPVHRREIFDSIRQGTGSESASTNDLPVAGPSRPRPGKPSGGLVLARSIRQSIMIGDDVELAVVEIRPSTVKLKITAPRSVAVHRREIFEALRDGPALS